MSQELLSSGPLPGRPVPRIVSLLICGDTVLLCCGTGCDLDHRVHYPQSFLHLLEVPTQPYSHMCGANLQAGVIFLGFTANKGGADGGCPTGGQSSDQWARFPTGGMTSPQRRGLANGPPLAGAWVAIIAQPRKLAVLVLSVLADYVAGGRILLPADASLARLAFHDH